MSEQYRIGIEQYRVGILAYGETTYSYNALTFGTKEEADEYAKNLFSRWTMVDKWRIEKQINGSWEPIEC